MMTPLFNGLNVIACSLYNITKIPETLLNKQYNTISNKNMSTPISEEEEEETNTTTTNNNPSSSSTPPVPPPSRHNVVANPNINKEGSSPDPALQQGNMIQTDAEVAAAADNTSSPHSSINPNAQENGQPVYTTENPLMQPPTSQQQTQSLIAQETQQQQDSTTNRSNPQEDPQGAVAAAKRETATRQKVDFTTTDATIHGLLIQIVALQHNKIQQLNTDQQQQ